MTNRIWILFYYNSLPDMPDDCSIFDKKIINRDFFMCNPSNTGHYQYPKFEDFSYDIGCHERELTAFLASDYEEKYVLFYTHHTELSGFGTNKLVGYFRVGKQFNNTRFIASDVTLLDKTNVVPINYTARGVPVCWGKSKVKDFINSELDKLVTLEYEDCSEHYKKETNKLMSLLSTKIGRKKLLDTCKLCPSKMQCFWGKIGYKAQRKRLVSLYNNESKC